MSAQEELAKVQLARIRRDQRNKDQTRAGCVGCIGVAILALIVGCAVSSLSGSKSGPPLSGNPDLSIQRVPSKKHGWITANRVSRSNDLFDSLDDFCAAERMIAAEVYDSTQSGRAVDDSIIARLPGHHDLENGVRVRLFGHSRTNCGTGSYVHFTRLQVIDSDSRINGRAGYTVEGIFSKQ